MNYTLRGSIRNANPYTVDKALKVEGAGADAKATGEAIAKAKAEAMEHTDEHANQKNNPHGVTAEQLGLENVDNTSDMDKPVSAKQAEAIAEAKSYAENAAKDAETNAKAYVDTVSVEAKAYADTVSGTVEANAKAYSDSLHKFFTVAVPASGWSETVPYAQTVAVEGVLGTDAPHWGIVYSEDLETAVAQKEAFAVVDELDTADGTVTFTCFEEKPEVDLTIQMEVNR